MLKTLGDISGPVEERADVVVVGTGAGGAPMAAELARGGLSVVLLEEGGHYRTEDYSLRSTEMMKKLYRNAGSSVIMGRPSIVFAEGRAVGGSTVINGGMCWRTPEHILQKWEWENGLEQIGAREMEPFFARVEKDASIGPQDPESVGAHSQVFHQGATRLGWKVIDNLRNQKHCAGSSVCVLGCPTGAKRSTLYSYIPVALQHGARLYANCRAEKVVLRNGRAAGISGHFVDELGRRSHRMTVHADAVVVAGGASETPALLFRSGIRARSGQLGRNLQAHPNAKVIGVFDRDISCWKGTHQAHQVREFVGEGIIFASGGVPPGLVALGSPEYGRAAADLMEKYNNMVVSACLIEDTSRGYVKTGWGGAAEMHYLINDFDVYRLKRGVSLISRLLFEAGAREVLLPFAHLPSLRSPDEIRRIFEERIPPTDIEIMTVHIMGTAQMGRNAASSVTDSYGGMHDMPGLFVSDASLFPSPIGVNPQETIMALSLRNAQHILDHRARLLGRTA